VKNHPYEYVYFNEFAGGIDKAFGNYELDYYYHSTREATEWIMKNADTTNLDGKKITIATWHQMSVDYFVHKDTNHFQSNFSRWYQRSENDWDYAVFTVTGIDPAQLKSGFFPPQNTVYQVKVDDIPICIVLKRENRDGFIATQYRDKNVIDSAIYFYEKAIEYDPNDEVMLCDLGSIYFQTRQMDKAVELFERGLKIAPNDAQMTYYMANYYAMIGDANQAINTCKEMIKANPKNGSPYNLLVNIYLQQRKSIDAQKVLESMMDYGVFDNTAAQTYVNIFTAAGLSEAAAYKKMYSALAKSFEKNGQKDLAKQYSDYAKQIR
jgi:tetratricopeptide (TPR) repeat protein